MPIYEYACPSCGERTEAKQSFDDPPLEVCLVCGGKLRRLYSPVGIVFKGSGFYSTDSKKKKATKGAAKPPPEAAAAADKPKKAEGKGAGAGSASEKPA